MHQKIKSNSIQLAQVSQGQLPMSIPALGRWPNSPIGPVGRLPQSPSSPVLLRRSFLIRYVLLTLCCSSSARLQPYRQAAAAPLLQDHHARRPARAADSAARPQQRGGGGGGGGGAVRTGAGQQASRDRIASRMPGAFCKFGEP